MSRTSSRARKTAANAFLRSLGLLLASSCLAGEPRWATVPDLPASLPVVKSERHWTERDLSRLERPGLVLPPQTMALGCATPTTAGTVRADHPYYIVYLDAGSGAFTAGTGPSHSVTALAGSSQNVIFGGSYGGPGTSDVSWRFHVQGVTYTNPGGGSACVFDPPDTAMEPASIGIEQEFTVSPEPGITCTLRQELVAFGTAEDNSGVRMTLSVTNHSTSSQYVITGVRWQIDYQNAGDDGPLYAPVTCDPPVAGADRSFEHEFAPAEIQDFYRIQNNDSTPIFSNVSSTTPIAGIPDTRTPDRLIYGRWGAMRASAWNYAATEGACCPDSDSAVMWYHGYQPADGDMLDPGQTSRTTVVIFSSPDRVDCGSFVPSCASSVTAPPADQTICIGDSAWLDASGISLVDCAGTVNYEWTDGVTTWPGAVVNVSPVDDTRYSVAITCSTDPACRVDDDMRILVNKPPDFQPPIGADPDACNSGIKLTWNPAFVYGASGMAVYNVYRSEISCADALLRPPIAIGLLNASYHDQYPTEGVPYYYVVQAEDVTPGTACRPTGPNGGSVTSLCTTAINDTMDSSPPAGAGPVLRVSHLGDQVSVTWGSLRPLLLGEHPHLRKAWLDPRNPFVRVGVDGDVRPVYTETDTSAWLQFFDLRVANSCERESAPDYPPTR